MEIFAVIIVYFLFTILNRNVTNISIQFDSIPDKLFIMNDQNATSAT